MKKLLYSNQTQPLKIRLQIVVIILSTLLSTSVYSEKPKPRAPESIDNVPIVSAEQAIEMILANPQLTIIDARKSTEFHKGHIEGAFNLLNTTLKEDDLQRLSPNKSKPILFYCNGIRCLRSSDAIIKAQQWGYNNLIWFRGGWDEWSSKGLPSVSR